MPPKVKITEEKILLASVEEVRANGWNNLNARSIAARLECSTQPIFRVYKNMEELKQAVWHKIEEIYNERMVAALMESPDGFHDMGLAYIRFATEEPRLFQALFMSGAFKINRIMDMVEREEEVGMIEMISKMTGLKAQGAKEFYAEIWLMVHGIASMASTNGCSFEEEEINRILGDAFWGIIQQIKKREEEENENESEK